MKVGTMPLFYGLRPWQTTLVVLLILGLVVSMLWIWKVKKRNPITCKRLDGKPKTPTGNKVAPEFGAIVGGKGLAVNDPEGRNRGGAASGQPGFINMDLGGAPPARDSRVQRNLLTGGSITVNQQINSVAGVRPANRGQRIVF